MTITTQEIEKRLEGLGWTLYKLAKSFALLKANGGEVSPVTRYHNAIGKAMENPAKSRLETIEGIIEALGGKIEVVWDDELTSKYTVKYFLDKYIIKMTHCESLDTAIALALIHIKQVKEQKSGVREIVF